MSRKSPIPAFAEGAAFTGPVCITGTIAALLAGGPGSLFWMAAAGLVSWLVSRKLAFLQRTRPEGEDFLSYAPKRLPAALFIPSAVFIGAFSLNQAGLSLTRALTELSLFTPSAVSWKEISGFKAFFMGMSPFRVVISFAGLFLAACLLFFRKKASVTGPVRKTLNLLTLGLVMIYAGMCLYLIVTHPGEIIHAAGRIVKYAFTFEAVYGGIFSHTLLYVIRTGFLRGLLISRPFETLYDASASRPGSASEAFLFGKTLVPVLISFLTGFMILTSMDVAILQGEEDLILYTVLVFKEGLGTFGIIAITVILIVFALNTISLLTAGAGNALGCLAGTIHFKDSAAASSSSVPSTPRESLADEVSQETPSRMTTKKQKSPSQALLPILSILYLVLIFVLSAAKGRFLLTCGDHAVLIHFLVCLVTLFRTMA